MARAISGVSSILSRAPPYKMLTLFPPSTRILDTRQFSICMVITKVSLCGKRTAWTVCVREGDRPTRGRGWACQDHPTGHVDLNGPLLRGDVLYRGGAKYGIYFLIVIESLSRLTLHREVSGTSLCTGLREPIGFKDELFELSLIH